MHGTADTHALSLAVEEACGDHAGMKTRFEVQHVTKRILSPHVQHCQQLLEEMKTAANLEQLREDYFIELNAKPKSLGNVFGRLIASAQNSAYRSNVINIKKNAAHIKSVIGDYDCSQFDLDRVATMDEENLLSQLRESCNVTSTARDSTKNSWRI